MRLLLVPTVLVILSISQTSMSVLASVNPLLIEAVVPTGNPRVSYVNSPVLGWQWVLSQSYLLNTTANLSTGLFMWVSVQNSAGQTVAVYLGSSTPPGDGQNFNASAVIFELPSGCCNYVAYVFVTTTSGIILSKETSASVPPVVPV